MHQPIQRTSNAAEAKVRWLTARRKGGAKDTIGQNGLRMEFINPNPNPYANEVYNIYIFIFIF